MSKKCESCNENIEEDDRGKLKGTMIKQAGKNEFKYLCSNCQKQGKKVQ